MTPARKPPKKIYAGRDTLRLFCAPAKHYLVSEKFEADEIFTYALVEAPKKAKKKPAKAKKAGRR